MKQLRGIISALEELNDNWNSKYWIFIEAGTLYLMKYKKNGETAVTDDGGMDGGYVVAEFPHILGDGGDW